MLKKYLYIIQKNLKTNKYFKFVYFNIFIKYKRIKHSKIKVPTTITPEFQSLLLGLFEKVPSKRLGSGGT